MAGNRGASREIAKIDRTLLKKILPLPLRNAIRAALGFCRAAPDFCLIYCIHNPYNYLFIGSNPKANFNPSDIKELNEIRDRANKFSDISDYLEILFLESLAVKPKLIVELGVDTGESTFALAQLARVCGATHISVDICDCSHVGTQPQWLFVQKEDLEFAREFPAWCRERNITSSIDILFIDTSHVFEHTLGEINSWFPFLSANSKVFLHDTNLTKVYFRKNGSMGIGWNNKRGVIRALEVFCGASFNEKEAFLGFYNGWLIRHYPYSCGLAVLQKVSKF